MIKFKQFNVGDSGYEEQMEKFQIEHPQAEFLQITGGHMSPEQIWFKYDDGAGQPKLSIPKKIAEELDKVPFHNPIAQLSNNDCDLTDFNDTVKRYAWNNKENGYICVAYLAGKALGVELVEVIDE
ncbi:hypothetical protein MKK30_06775 [Lactococcus formosensis]|uniref:hypothetical protein n=1 Tax=Lactococcus formosensis TaxID=1281486 RepID=UPI001F0695D7|nr:hypothetical protein [Lactococcus formosensis]MCH1723335.1 hypothetical protein [Lactococcus formosensis]